MKEIINQTSIDLLKKRKRPILICIIISIVVTIALIVPLFFLASREYKFLFIILLTTISTIEASFVLYICAVSLVPLNKYIKLSTLSLNGGKYLTKGQVTSINEKLTHYRGVAVFEIKVKDLEEENKEYIFYVEQTHVSEFANNKTYSFFTYQSLIVGYDDVI